MMGSLRAYEARRIEEEDIEHTPDKVPGLTSWAITQSLQRTAKRYAHPRLSSPKPPSSPSPQG
jgi:hypothetical protein